LRHLPERTLRIGIVHEACAQQRACYHISTCVSIGFLLRPMAEADRHELYHRGRNDARAFIEGHTHDSLHYLTAQWDDGGTVSSALRFIHRASLMAACAWLRRRQRPNAQYSKRAIVRLLCANARSEPHARTVVSLV